MASGGRGQQLVPWPNRIRDGRYDVDGRAQQLALTEPARAQRLARAGALGRLLAARARRGLRRARLPAGGADRLPVDARRPGPVRRGPGRADRHPGRDQPGRLPRALRGRARTPTSPPATGPATAGRSPSPPPPGCSPTPSASCRPAPSRSPARRTTSARVGRSATCALDHAFTDLAGPLTVTLRGPDAAVELWADAAYGWVMVYTGDDNAEGTRRRSVAVEPMTAPADAFNSGDGLRMLAPGRVLRGLLGDPLGASQALRLARGGRGDDHRLELAQAGRRRAPEAVASPGCRAPSPSRRPRGRGSPRARRVAAGRRRSGPTRTRGAGSR